MGSDVEHLARLEPVGDAGDGKLEGAAKEKRPLLVPVGVIGDDGAWSYVDPALGDLLRVDVTAAVPGSDLSRRHGGEIKELHGSSNGNRGSDHYSTNTEVRSSAEVRLRMCHDFVTPLQAT